MPRSEAEKETLRMQAKALIAQTGVQLASEETTGENDFRFKEYPDVRAVVVDVGSGEGFVQVSGGDGPTTKIQTGKSKSGFRLVDILDGQNCMLYGRPTVIYVKPAT